ncbi:hypothetical protein M413DRAFT_21916 [Hebeloma cylindrosporum]|uniref:Uncharacterized protein n=1 Tax=Hebeloma cylindrosporum TaxID=76867 RepID=A0A0C2Z9E7_HEBCY|nr:hypothetical protein M413DRAFT_21916 [Hebeloma cylindrosporum h7]
MRFNVVLLSISFLATLAVGLVIPYQNIKGRNQDLRAGFLDGAHDFIVFKREPKFNYAKKAFNSLRGAAKKSILATAAKAHRLTTNLPSRHSTFHVPAGPKPHQNSQTYTGKAVRKTIFGFHLGMLCSKPFRNALHKLPKADGTGGTKPLPHMSVGGGAPKGKEIDLPNNLDPSRRGPARVIIQPTGVGGHDFKGVVAHDQSRKPGLGDSDHFQVHPKP